MEDTNTPQVTGRGASPSPEPCVPEAPAILSSKFYAGDDEDTKAAFLLAGRYDSTPEHMLSLVKTLRSELFRRPGLKWKGIMKCDVTGDCKIFHIMESDSPKTLVERYLRVFHAEAEQFRLEVVREKLRQNDPKGFTQSREMLLFVQTPHKLRELLKILDPSYWEDQQNAQKLREEYSLLGGKA